MNVVVVEDQLHWAEMVSSHVETLGHDVSLFACKADALKNIWTIMPDILIVDATLPDGSMLEELSKIRNAFPAMGIIVMTGNLHLHVQCMNNGADYYLTKPFPLPILNVTLVALERRLLTISEMPEGSHVWVLDSARRKFISNQGLELELTAKEGIVLSLLIQNPRFPVSHTKISSALGYPEAIYDQHRIDVILYRLRKKLSLIPNGGFMVRNVYAEGFLLVRGDGVRCALQTA